MMIAAPFWVPDAEVPRRVAGEVEDLDAPLRPEPHRLPPPRSPASTGESLPSSSRIHSTESSSGPKP